MSATEHFFSALGADAWAGYWRARQGITSAMRCAVEVKR